MDGTWNIYLFELLFNLWKNHGKRIICLITPQWVICVGNSCTCVGEYVICTPCLSQGVVYEQGQNPRFTPTFLQGALAHIEQVFIPQIPHMKCLL